MSAGAAPLRLASRKRPLWVLYSTTTSLNRKALGRVSLPSAFAPFRFHFRPSNFWGLLHYAGLFALRHGSRAIGVGLLDGFRHPAAGTRSGGASHLGPRRAGAQRRGYARPHEQGLPDGLAAAAAPRCRKGAPSSRLRLVQDGAAGEAAAEAYEHHLVAGVDVAAFVRVAQRHGDARRR